MGSHRNHPGSGPGTGFIPSKWETVDPDQIEAQAITTSMWIISVKFVFFRKSSFIVWLLFLGKWDTLDPVAPDPPTISNASEDSFDSFDGADNNRDFDELKRMRLREIEIQTVQYQDELESGQRPIKSGWTMQQQIEHYRRKLLKKSDREALDSPSVSARRDLIKRSPSPLSYDSSKKSKKSRRSRSASSSSSRSRSRSTSPYAKSSRRSAERGRSSKRQRSNDSYSSSPKRYVKDRHSPSPVRGTSKYANSPRRHNR